MVQPLHEYFVIEVIDAPGTTKSGIIISDGTKKQAAKARIVAVSDCFSEFETVLKVGDIVLYSKYAPLEIPLEVLGESVTIISYEDIYAIVTDDTV